MSGVPRRKNIVPNSCAKCLCPHWSGAVMNNSHNKRVINLANLC